MTTSIQQIHNNTADPKVLYRKLDTRVSVVDKKAIVETNNIKHRGKNRNIVPKHIRKKFRLIQIAG